MTHTESRPHRTFGWLQARSAAARTMRPESIPNHRAGARRALRWAPDLALALTVICAALASGCKSGRRALTSMLFSPIVSALSAN